MRVLSWNGTKLKRWPSELSFCHARLCHKLLKSWLKCQLNRRYSISSRLSQTNSSQRSNTSNNMKPCERCTAQSDAAARSPQGASVPHQERVRFYPVVIVAPSHCTHWQWNWLFSRCRRELLLLVLIRCVWCRWWQRRRQCAAKSSVVERTRTKHSGQQRHWSLVARGRP